MKRARNYSVDIAPALVLFMAGFFALGGCAGGPSLESGMRILDRRSDRLMVTLDNGLVVIAQRMAAAPVVSVQCWVKTGSIFEGAHNGSGLSHFLEHLVAGGTTSNRSEEVSHELLGRMGADTNAGTGLDTVQYHIDTSSEHAADAVDLLSDWILHSLIAPKEFQRERQVIGREFLMGRGDPGRILWSITQQARYNNHPARHPIIGYEEEFESVQRDQVADFYKKMYVPNNMVFVVVGDIDPVTVVNQVSRLWAGAAPGKLPEITFPTEEPITEPRRVTGHADIDRPRLRLVWPGVRLGSENDFALDLLGAVLGQGELSRLVQVVRDQKQLVTSIDSFNYSASWGEGFFGVDAVVAPDKMEQAREAILEEVRRILAEGPAQEELARAKRKVVAGAVYAAQTAHETAERVASDFIHTANPDYLDHYAQVVQSLTSADLVAAANRYLQPQRLITVELLPLDGPPPIVKRLPDSDIKPVGQEKMDLDNSALVRRMSAAKAAAVQAGSEEGSVRMHRLANGLRVLIHRNSRLPIVSVQWYQMGGLLADEPGREGVANAVSEMMIRGAGPFSANDISRQIEDLGADITTGCGNSTFFASAICLSGDWRKVLGLTSQVILKPTFPEDEWRMMQPRLLARIAQMKDLWYEELRTAFREAYFGNHPWSRPSVGRKEIVGAITAADLRQFHADRIGASEGVLAVYGDIQEQEVLEEVGRLFGGMPAKAKVPFKPLKPAGFDSRMIQVPTQKPTTAVVIGYGPGVERISPDYPALEVMTSVMSSFPVGYLDKALRGEGEGLVYAVGAGIFTGAVPGYWSVLFNTKTETLTPALNQALAQIRRIQDEVVEDATLQRARTAVLVSEAIGRQSNAQRAGMACLDELYGLGYDDAQRYINQIRAVTAKDIQRVARKYMARPLGVILTDTPVDAKNLPALVPQATSP